MTSKFKLEGDIEAERQSEYVKKELDQYRKRTRNWQIGSVSLGLLLLVAVVWGLIGSRTDTVNDSSATGLQVIDSLTQRTENLQMKLDSLIISNSELRRDNEILSENSEDLNGVFFEVQLGSFNDFDLDRYLANLANLRQEKYDGNTKLLLGRFRSFKKALLFESDLKNIGFEQAFIVGRINGELVTYKEALQAVQAAK